VLINHFLYTLPSTAIQTFLIFKGALHFIINLFEVAIDRAEIYLFTFFLQKRYSTFEAQYLKVRQRFHHNWCSSIYMTPALLYLPQ